MNNYNIESHICIYIIIYIYMCMYVRIVARGGPVCAVGPAHAYGMLAVEEKGETTWRRIEK